MREMERRGDFLSAAAGEKIWKRRPRWARPWPGEGMWKTMRLSLSSVGDFDIQAHSGAGAG